MSDSEEYEYEYDSDEQYDQSDSEIHDEQVIEIENNFYEAEDIKNTKPKDALNMFLRVVELETARGEEVKWRFKALENVVILAYHLSQFDVMLKKYQEMLVFMPKVTRNECTDSINSILDCISTATDTNILSKIYETTLSVLKTTNNERLWFNTNVKLGKLYLELEDYQQLSKIITDLHQSCLTNKGEQDLSKATNLLDIYCLEIQMYTAMKNTCKLREIYPKTLSLDGALADPRIMGIIREEGGKMYMSEAQWTKAYNEFFEGFRNYQEAGNARAKNCLIYVVLASMLASSDINPFDSREAKVYKDEFEVNNMILLRSAYEQNDINQFEKILRDERNKMLEDPLTKKYLDPLLRNMRQQVLKKYVDPYQRVRFDRMAEELNISTTEVELLVIDLINSEQLKARIDQAQGILVMQGIDDKQRTFEALEAWTNALKKVHRSTQSRYLIT